MPGPNTEPLKISSISYLPLPFKYSQYVYVCTCTHALVYRTLSTCGGQWSMSGVFSTALCLPCPFPLRKSSAAGPPAQLAREDTVVEVSRESRVMRTEQRDPAEDNYRYSASLEPPIHTLGREHTLPSSVLLGAHLKCVTHGWTTLAFFSSRKSTSDKNLATPESEFHFREGEGFSM